MPKTLAHMMGCLVAAQVAVIELTKAIEAKDEQGRSRETHALIACCNAIDTQLTIVRRAIKQGTL